MFFFGLGTMPALVFATGAAARFGQLLRRRTARRAVGALLVAFGCWTIYVSLAPGHANTEGTAPHSHHARVSIPSQRAA